MNDHTKTACWIRWLADSVRNHSIKACEAKAQSLTWQWDGLGAIANIGGGAGERWPWAANCDAMHDPSMDFNTQPLPWDEGTIGLAVCEQVIEHLHNTTFFLSELHRILKPGGTLIISTENLASLPNLFALLCQRAPFSTQAVCGQFIGGWKRGPAGPVGVTQSNHPTFSGVRGHVRVMTTGQLWILLEQAGFKVQRKYGFGFNHYVLFSARKKVLKNS